MQPTLLPIPLQTDRLVLRDSLSEDGATLHACYFGLKETSRFLTRSRHESVTDSEAFLNQWCRQAWISPADSFAWVIADRLDGKAIGVFLAIVKGHVVEVHYGIGSGHSGRGYATEAGAAVTDWLFSNASIQRIWTAVDTEHRASRRVLEKLRFQPEGVLRQWAVLPEFGTQARDAVSYSRTRSD